MNKRQMKKLLKREDEETRQWFREIALSSEHKQTKRMRHLFVYHRRRHWMSRSDYQANRIVLQAELDAEKRAIQER